MPKDATITDKETEESEEEEDKVFFHLKEMLKAMAREGKANEVKNKIFNTLMQISLD